MRYEDASEGDVYKALKKYYSDAKKRGPGTYTASQTGAYQLARMRAKFLRTKEMMGSANQDTKSFEDYIRGGK